jgi:hypothetical protein
VSREELRKLILELGGSEDEDGVYDGGLANRVGGVWIKWATESEKEYLREVEAAAENERDEHELWTERERLRLITETLGAPPLTFVHMDVLRAWVSDRLALRFIKAFCKRWPPCALRDYIPLGETQSGRDVWSIPDLLEYTGSYGRMPR